MRPDNGVVSTGSETYAKDAEPDHDHSLNNDSDSASDYSEAQAGVKRIEAVSKAWTKTSLIVAYVTYVHSPRTRMHVLLIDQSRRLLLIANVTSLEIQVTGLLTPYATSAFQTHSLISTIYVVQGVVSGEPTSDAKLVRPPTNPC